MAAGAGVLGIVVLVLALAAPAQAISAAGIVRVINRERKANHLPPVRNGRKLSKGCAAHDRYEIRNARTTDEIFNRNEDPSKPGYSKAGNRCAHNALLAFGSRSSLDPFNNDDWARGDVFDNAPGHLFALMSPAVQTVGADQLNAPPSRLFPGRLYNSSIDVRSAPHRRLAARVRAYVYWGPNGHPSASVTYVEGPTAGRVSGPWIFIYFLAPKHTKIKLLSLTLTPRGGTPVPVMSFVTGGLIDRRPRAARTAAATIAGFGFSSDVPAAGFVPNHEVAHGTYDLTVKTNPPPPGSGPVTSQGF